MSGGEGHPRINWIQKSSQYQWEIPEIIHKGQCAQFCACKAGLSFLGTVKHENRRWTVDPQHWVGKRRRL